MPDLDPFTLTDEQFDAAMVEIDNELRQQSDNVVGRPLGGLVLFVKRFRVQIDNRHPLQQRIFAWFDRVYGDRLRIDRDFGQAIVLINGESCKVSCPWFFANFPVACTPAAIGTRLRIQSPHGPIDVRNLLESGIEGLTLDLAARLQQAECDQMLTVFGDMFMAFCGMEAALGARYGKADAPYIKEAMDDLRASSDSLLGSRPNYGQSKWNSLQAVEKILKSCIIEKGGMHAFSHHLNDLASAVAALGVPAVDPAWISSVQCAASVRYDSSLVSKSDARAAHHSALRICRALAPVVKKTDAQIGFNEFPFQFRNGIVFPCILLGYGSPTIPRPTSR
jgi:HEPN domain-containing protein